MNRERDGKERLLDTLLEERFTGGDEAARIAARVRAAGAEELARAAALAEAAAAGAEPRRGMRWLAAAVMLLGAAILVVVVSQQRVQPPRFAQDPPSERKLLEPRALLDLEYLLGRATKLHLQRQEIVGSRPIDQPNGSGEELVVRARPGRVTVAGEDLAQWIRGLGRSLPMRADTNTMHELLQATFEQPDGSAFALTLSVGDAQGSRVFLGIHGEEPVQPDPVLLGLMTAARDELQRQHRESEGIAETLAQLAALPAERERIDVPLLGAGMPEALARFTNLRELTLRSGPGDLDVPLLTALQQLPLRRLVLVDPPVPDAAARRAFARFQKLEELHLLGCPFDGAELRDLLPSFASLRSLVVHGPQLDAAWLEALPRTRIEALTVLGGKVHADDLAKLAAAPALRDLGFVLPELDDGDVETLDRLKLLTQLRVLQSALTKDGLEQVRRLLPGCRVSGDVGMRWFDPRDAVAPR